MFILTTILIMFCLGGIFKRKSPIKWVNIDYNSKVSKITFILLFFHIVNILYAGYIPLLEILLRRGFNYSQEFVGIPFIQTFLLSSTSFFTTYLYHMYLSEKKKKILLLIIINLIPLALVFYRSLIVITLMNCVWLKLFKIKKIGVKYVFALTIFFLIAGYIFGVSGDIRTSNQVGIFDDSSSEIIMQMGGASQKFRDSIIPKPYYWVYLYSTSSLANFQSITETYNNQEVNINTFAEFINSEILYSMISERINVLYNKNRVPLSLNSPALTVSSVYGRSYYYLGWLGPLLMFQFILVLSVIYHIYVKKMREYFLICLSILNTLIFMNVFSNMIVWTTLSIQLLFPFFIRVYKSMRVKIKH
jgi:hypothetical protein